MIDKQQIIIGHFRQGKSARQLAKELNISRNTVMKYIKEYKSDVLGRGQNYREKLPIEGVVKKPTYNSVHRSKRALNKTVRDIIEVHLAQNIVKKKNGKHKQQMLGKDIHQSLLEQGHQIGYTTVCRYIRQVKQKSAEVYIRQHYSPGQAVEFDWGIVKITIEGKDKTMMLAVFTSSYSNHRWARLFYRQDMSSFLHSHACYFAYTKAVPQEMVYDNMRVAVRKFSMRNSDKLPTEDLLKLSVYYQFDYRFCNARRGNEKGHVERSVDYIRRKAFAAVDDFESLEAANKHLLEKCEQLNKGVIKDQTQRIEELFTEELKYMRTAPSPYDAAELRNLKVDKYSCIKVDTNYYSVPEGWVNTFINVKVYPDLIEIYNNHNMLIASHERRNTRFKYYLSLDHYLKTLRTKPGALLGSLTLHQADQALKDIFNTHYKQRHKDFIELLLYIREHKYSIIQLQCAIDKCISKCPRHPLDLDKLKILLAQKLEPNNQDTIPVGQMSQQIEQNAVGQLRTIQSLISLT